MRGSPINSCWLQDWAGWLGTVGLGGGDRGRRPRACANMPSINSPKRWEPCTTDKATYTGLPLAAHALACVVRADVREDLNSWLKSNDHREWSQETFGSRFA